MNMNSRDIKTKIREEASRILKATRLAPDGKELAEVLHFHEETNQLALEAWIRDQVGRLGLQLNHTSSRELELRVAHIFLLHFPKRYNLLFGTHHKASNQSTPPIETDNIHERTNSMNNPPGNLNEIIRAQTHRILRTFGFAPNGHDLTPVLDETLRTNFKALEHWIHDQIRHKQLVLDHTLSHELDQLIIPIIHYHWPERCIGFQRSA